MNLTERINEDMKLAMKSGNAIELQTLRGIRAAILEFQKRGVGIVLTEEDELSLLSTAAKNRRDSIEQYAAGGRADLVEQETKELEVIQRYLPAPLTEMEIEKLIADQISDTGAAGMKDMGRVMGPVMKKTKGRADGNLVQSLVKKALGGA